MKRAVRKDRASPRPRQRAGSTNLTSGGEFGHSDGRNKPGEPSLLKSKIKTREETILPAWNPQAPVSSFFLSMPARLTHQSGHSYSAPECVTDMSRNLVWPLEHCHRHKGKV